MSRVSLTVALSVAVVAAAFIAPQLRPQTAAADTPANPPLDDSVVNGPAGLWDPEDAQPDLGFSEIEPVAPPSARPAVDLVIALDTSDSMGGLLDSTRAQVWDIVSRAASAEPTPDIRVGLVTFGTMTGSQAEDGWVITRTDLTRDLDLFYEELMALQTIGQPEYVGWAVDRAVNDLDWSTGDNATRMLIVAGNESAYQGPYNPRVAAARAQNAGITVHTIFAGNRWDGRELGWADVAQSGGGKYSAIDMNRAVVTTATPFDQRLQALNSQLNDTYMPYGAGGSAGMNKLRSQDRGSAGTGSLSARVTAKASSAYRNEKWDLVDALDAGMPMEAIPEADLPAPVAAAAPADRTKMLKKKKAERQAVQAEIASVAKERRRWIADAEPAPAADEDIGFDDALEAMVEETMEASGLEFAE